VTNQVQLAVAYGFEYRDRNPRPNVERILSRAARQSVKHRSRSVPTTQLREIPWGIDHAHNPGAFTQLKYCAYECNIQFNNRKYLDH